MKCSDEPGLKEMFEDVDEQLLSAHDNSELEILVTTLIMKQLDDFNVL